MAGLSDAGVCYRQYTCKRCDLKWYPVTTSEDDAKHADHFDRYGTSPDWKRMCPRCNTAEVFKAWGVIPDPFEVEAPDVEKVEPAFPPTDWVGLLSKKRP